jgi:hypothetical protein
LVVEYHLNKCEYNTVLIGKPNLASEIPAHVNVTQSPYLLYLSVVEGSIFSLIHGATVVNTIKTHPPLKPLLVYKLYIANIINRVFFMLQIIGDILSDPVTRIKTDSVK